MGARIFSSAEVAYYPLPGRKPKDNLKASLAFGVNLPINDMIAIGLYYNCVNLGSRAGDIERTSLINFSF